MDFKISVKTLIQSKIYAALNDKRIKLCSHLVCTSHFYKSQSLQRCLVFLQLEKLERCL